MQYVTHQDIMDRLLRRHPCWGEEPKIELVGEEHKFGILKFDFGEGLVITYRIFISEKDKIMEVVNYAIKNFSQLSKKYFEIWE